MLYIYIDLVYGCKENIVNWICFVVEKGSSYSESIMKDLEKRDFIVLSTLYI